MSKQLFAARGPNGPMFFNPANVIGIFLLPSGKTLISTTDGFENETTDDIRDVVDRYQTALGLPSGYSHIVQEMEIDTRMRKEDK